ncbi:MAG: hypothetical protein OSB34_07115 [Planktomarina sp.]|nr:hypothetical protein [Planktomarina sp.]|tara:strand:+ start:644 stop:874 length:231 start_codon:yes stop_codon:yes gene_type:complete
MKFNDLRMLTILASLIFSAPVIAGLCGGSHDTNALVDAKKTAAVPDRTESETTDEMPLPAGDIEPETVKGTDTVDA